MSASKPQVWRKIQTGMYPGQYSCSSADFLDVNITVSYLLDLKPEEPRPTIQVRYRIGGDEVNMFFYHDLDDALDWVKNIVWKAIADNAKALNTGKDIQIEDT